MRAGPVEVMHTGIVSPVTRGVSVRYFYLVTKGLLIRRTMGNAEDGVSLKGAFGGRDVGVAEYWKFAKLAASCPNSQSSRMEWKNGGSRRLADQY
jgi:hypothetical protein